MVNNFSVDFLLRVVIAWIILSALGIFFTKQAYQLSKGIIFGVLIRLMLAWVTLSALGFIFAIPLVKSLLPSVNWLINLLQEDYSASLTLTDQGRRIELMSILHHDIPPLVVGDTLTTLSTTLHFMISPVLFYSLLFAWPVKQFQSRIKLLILSTPFIFLLVTLMISCQLVAVNEMTLQTYASQADIERDEPFILAWMNFIQNGGAWLRSIALAAIGTAILPGARFKAR